MTQHQYSGQHLLTVAEAAELLGCSPRSIYGWIAERRIPYRKLGRAVRFVPSELLEWTKPTDDRRSYNQFTTR